LIFNGLMLANLNVVKRGERRGGVGERNKRSSIVAGKIFALDLCADVDCPITGNGSESINSDVEGPINESNEMRSGELVTPDVEVVLRVGDGGEVGRWLNGGDCAESEESPRCGIEGGEGDERGDGSIRRILATSAEKVIFLL
jgi:hypothetical protein